MCDFEDKLPFPLNGDIRPDPLTVDWDAMAGGNTAKVLAVVEAWRRAAEMGDLDGHALPYDRFRVQQNGKWIDVLHVDRCHYFDGKRICRHDSGPRKW